MLKSCMQNFEVISILKSSEEYLNAPFRNKHEKRLYLSKLLCYLTTNNQCVLFLFYTIVLTPFMYNRPTVCIAYVCDTPIEKLTSVMWWSHFSKWQDKLTVMVPREINPREWSDANSHLSPEYRKYIDQKFYVYIYLYHSFLVTKLAFW